jgi:hypothetical protein
MQSARAGMTLVEVCIGLAMLTLMTAGIYASGILVRRMVVLNSMHVQARALALEKLEEVSALTVEEILAADPFPSQEFHVRAARITQPGQEREIVRTVDVVAHEASGTPSTNIWNNAYLEVHVYAAFDSPVTGRAATNTVSTVVM